MVGVALLIHHELIPCFGSYIVHGALIGHGLNALASIKRTYRDGYALSIQHDAFVGLSGFRQG